MDAHLLQRFIRGDSSPSETEQVIRYFATPDGQQRLSRLLDAQLPLEHRPLDTAGRAAAEALFARIERARTAGQPTQTPIRPLGQRYRWLAAAVVSLLLLAVGGWWLVGRLTQPPRLTVTTAYGQTRTVRLPDGSVVTLNGNSAITYAERWAATEPREVWAQGESFFDVVHTPTNQSFTVRLPDGIRVDVLGTRFNVYSRKAQTKVALDTGKIRLSLGSKTSSPMVMKPGELFIADRNANTYALRRANAQALSSWRSDRLLLDGISLADIGRMLEDNYGVTVAFADPALARQTVSGAIPNQNIDTILRGLATLYDLKITRTANRLLIEPNKP